MKKSFNPCKKSYFLQWDVVKKQKNPEDLENLLNQFNTLCIQYAYACELASVSGRNLTHYGKKVKPYLYNQIDEIGDFLQLKLF